MTHLGRDRPGPSFSVTHMDRDFDVLLTTRRRLLRSTCRRGPLMGAVNDLNERWVLDYGLPGPDAGHGGMRLLLPPGLRRCGARRLSRGERGGSRRANGRHLRRSLTPTIARPMPHLIVLKLGDMCGLRVTWRSVKGQLILWCDAAGLLGGPTNSALIDK
jgi:hypothetical protein